MTNDSPARFRAIKTGQHSLGLSGPLEHVLEYLTNLDLDPSVHVTVSFSTPAVIPALHAGEGE